MTEIKYPLSSYNEWGRLREVVVGNPFPSVDYLVDYSFYHFHFENVSTHIDLVHSKAAGQSVNATALRYRPEYLMELKEDIDGLVSALEARGINVLRPKQVDAN